MKIKNRIVEANDETLQNAIENRDVTTISSNSLEDVLDDFLKEAKRTQRDLEKVKDDPEAFSNLMLESDYPNVMFVSVPGAGKTTQVKAWAHKRGLNVVTLPTSMMDDPDVGGAMVPDKIDVEDEEGNKTQVNRLVKMSTQTLDGLDKPNSVLFLDEFNRGRSFIRGTLLKVLSEHIRPEGSTFRTLPNFLFTIGCINPDNGFNDVIPMNDAETARFEMYFVEPSKEEWVKYFRPVLERRLERAKAYGDPDEIAEDEQTLEIFDIVMADPKVDFDNAKGIEKSHNGDPTENGQIATPRTLAYAFKMAHGDPDKFLRHASGYLSASVYSAVKSAIDAYKAKLKAELVKKKMDKTGKVIQNNDTKSELLKNFQKGKGTRLDNKEMADAIAQSLGRN